MKPFQLSTRTIRLLSLTARLLLGASFIFSGFVKAIDPLGGSYKIEEYLDAFGWVYLKDFSMLIAFLLPAAELVLGATLLTGIYRRAVSLCVLLFMLLYTPLTLYIALTNPVKDCGCFGEALILSNPVTFGKNLLLLAMAFLVYRRNDKLFTLYGWHTARYALIWMIAFPLCLSFYSYRHLPLLDFLPYKTGNHLPDLMAVPPGAATDSIATVFIYEKEGVQKKFSLEEAPYNDSTWKFIDRVDEVVREGYRPPIHDFVLDDPQLGDVTREVLDDESYTFLMVSNRLEEMNPGAVQRMLDAKSYAAKHGYRFLALTHSGTRAIEDWKYEYDDNMHFCSLDDKTLKSMIRSNPGLLLLKGGTVYQKWAFRDIPDFSAEKRPLHETESGTLGEEKRFRIVAGLLFVLFIPLALFWMLHRGYRIKPVKSPNDSDLITNP